MDANRLHTIGPAAPQQQWAELREYAEGRAVIEQAKGMLMFIYGMNQDDAFGLLRQQSQDHNIKLRLIAEQIVKDLVGFGRASGPSGQERLGEVLLSAHDRVANA